MSGLTPRVSPRSIYQPESRSLGQWQTPIHEELAEFLKRRPVWRNLQHVRPDVRPTRDLRRLDSGDDASARPDQRGAAIQQRAANRVDQQIDSG